MFVAITKHEMDQFRAATPYAWAKLDETGALPLSDHGADVGATLGALLEQPHWIALLEHAAQRPLSPLDLERLRVLAYLHDLGKANRGFWARQFAGSPIVGHTNETGALFFSRLAREPAVVPLNALIDDWGCWEHFVAVMAHHGTPLRIYTSETKNLEPGNRSQNWQADAHYDPMAQLAALMGDVGQRFPAAFGPGRHLPDNPAFVALLGGMVTLTDWLGSDPTLFPVGEPHLEMRERLRAVSAPAAIHSRGLAHESIVVRNFHEAFGFGPRGAQAEASDPALGRIALLEAETGSGKTEAAIWRWLALREAGAVDGLYFALPTRAAAVQLHGRINAVLERLTGGAVNAVLAVPGYIRSGRDEADRVRDDEERLLPGFDVVWPDGQANDGRWAAEHPKRFLAARVAVGTIDQALMAGLQLRHAHFRATMLARSLLVVDEVHSSDHFMGEVLRAVLRNHTTLGGHALLLSATLTAEMRARLLDPFAPALEFPALDEAVATPYPALSGSHAPPRPVGSDKRREKPVKLTLLGAIDDPQGIAARAVEAARKGASVLIVRNSVNGAVAVAQAVEALAPELAFRAGHVATLHHSRFAPDDRRLLDAAVETAFGKGRSAQGRILCGTQTLEQSLDIDADLLLTDLAPMDVLLQRIGRLHRHDRHDRGTFLNAEAIVLAPKERDLSLYLGRVRDRHGLGPMADGGGVYPDMLAIEATWRLIETNSEIAIPADNRRLVEEALHPDRADALQQELGTDWMNHLAQQQGIAIADRQTAQAAALDVRIPFSELVFPKDMAIATRLGARDRLAMFDSPVPGPFGTQVERLTVPDWMARGISTEAVPEVLISGDVLRFAWDDASFIYDRFGLRRST
ncbi:CRISPR-associated endonuclease/helicase Cas3 [Sphingobium fontiphilum]|uniref:CRISPR-associated endonuclease/helicase Cas3 n=1 Tax=Sphingobium fontiphilum TaxID=944425 RepID=A0A7W6GQY7_9SPHN|nr:CRISPR-associated endonuclease/helicase Cas3 [Sphingobium fontiphilum]